MGVWLATYLPTYLPTIDLLHQSPSPNSSSPPFPFLSQKVLNTAILRQYSWPPRCCSRLSMIIRMDCRLALLWRAGTGWRAGKSSQHSHSQFCEEFIINILTTFVSPTLTATQHILIDPSTLSLLADRYTNSPLLLAVLDRPTFTATAMQLTRRI